MIDVYAAILAALLLVAIGKVLFYLSDGSCKNSNKPLTMVRTTVVSTLIIFGAVSITASNHVCNTDTITDTKNQQCEPKVTPVYLSYYDLRNNSIRVTEKKALTETGKIYLYRHYILISNPNTGIHIYDNSDPKNPLHVLFINIPGNLDIAVMGDYLYADSYVDLVTLDIRNIDTDVNSVVETHRIENIFPYDAYQNIPDGIYLGYVDESRGVVVGYTNQ